MTTANPFEVLQLDPRASEEEIVRQAGRLRQRTVAERELNAQQQAVQALMGSTDVRLLHALLTFPAPQQAWPALEKLSQAFRRAPFVTEEPPPPCPPLDVVAVAELVRPLVVQELELPLQPLPLTQPLDTPEEVARQTIEGLWQLLLADPEAIALAPQRVDGAAQ